MVDLQTEYSLTCSRTVMPNLGTRSCIATNVLYKSSDDGLVNIFASKIDSGMRYRVTSSRFGADYPTISPDGSKLLFSDYTSEDTTWPRFRWIRHPGRRSARSYTSGLGYLNAIETQARRLSTGNTHQKANRRRSTFAVHSWGFTSGPPSGFGLISTTRWVCWTSMRRCSTTQRRNTGFRTVSLQPLLSGA